MAPRTSRRSGGSQPTRPGKTNTASQTQRHQPAPDEEEEEEEQYIDEEEPEIEGYQVGTGKNDMERKAHDLVRLALFIEYRRGTLKRDEINKKILGRETRSFNAVFERAQKILRRTFGMQLVELMTRAERENTGEVAENATTGMKKRQATSSKTYILQSLLDPSIIQAAAQLDQQILQCERSALANGEEEEAITDGAIIAWRTADHLAAFGITQVVLSLILVAGKVISDQQLRAQLKSLRLSAGAMVEMGPQASQKTQTIDTYLTSLIRMGYLDKQKTSVSANPAPARGRVRRRGDDGDDGQVGYEWRWGSRAQAEVSEEGIARFMVDFLLEREARNKDAIRERLLKDITRAAGGSLTEISPR